MDEHDLPEETVEQVLGKIQALAWEIRGDWSDPRHECREIARLCSKGKDLLDAEAKQRYIEAKMDQDLGGN